MKTTKRQTKKDPVLVYIKPEYLYPPRIIRRAINRMANMQVATYKQLDLTDEDITGTLFFPGVHVSSVAKKDRVPALIGNCYLSGFIERRHKTALFTYCKKRGVSVHFQEIINNLNNLSIEKEDLDNHMRFMEKIVDSFNSNGTPCLHCGNVEGLSDNTTCHECGHRHSNNFDFEIFKKKGKLVR